MSKHRLLILSCSARKHAIRNKVKAWNLYDGVSFRVVKKAQREERMPTDVDILILSAKHGLIHPTTKIAFYDQRITRNIAMQQAIKNCALLCRFLQSGRYVEVFANVGKTYLAALQPIEAWLPNRVKLIVPGGGIGQKMRQMKQWLLRQQA